MAAAPAKPFSNKPATNPEGSSAEAASTASTGHATITKLSELRDRTLDNRTRFQQAAEIIADHFCSPYVLLQGQSVSRQFQHEVHHGALPPETWRQVCSIPLLECLTAQKSDCSVFKEHRTDLQVAVLTSPLRDGTGELVGAIGVIVLCNESTTPSSKLTELQALLAILQTARKPGASGRANKSDQGALLMNSLQTAASFSTMHELAFALTNTLKSKVNCQEVALGVAEGERIRLLSISGMDNLYPRSPGSVTIRQAMEECFDIGKAVCSQRSTTEGKSDGSEAQYALHNRWRIQSGGSNVLSVPLIFDGKKVGVISFRREDGETFSATDIEQLTKQLEPISAAVAFLRRASRSLPRHIVDSIRGALLWLRSQKTTKRLLYLGVALLLFGGLTWEWPYQLSVPCRIAPTQAQVLAAPFAGRVKAVYVRSGQKARSGELLFEMETAELESQLSRLEAEKSLYHMQMVKALSDRRPAEAGEAQANIRSMEAQIAAIESQISNAKVYADSTGTILDGKLEQRIGEMVTLGDPLMQFAPMENQIVELLIPEQYALEIRPGQEGAFATSAQPNLRKTIAIERIDAQATVENGTNLVKAVAVGLEGPVDDRIGMEGFAQVSVGKQPGWWILLHKPIRYLQRKVWQL